ncbi:hypothetical protein AVEN_96405-1 [Araneus ventricosus]|uniref:Uncharacterized protein n=1 Tax=Araneus ventricosus TaxID=182803 RepID=A0A4Y2WKL8_ARAVE|nr:hypothetical protein AVEN_96405-1 [Araneus ventricosus]
MAVLGGGALTNSGGPAGIFRVMDGSKDNTCGSSSISAPGASACSGVFVPFLNKNKCCLGAGCSASSLGTVLLPRQSLSRPYTLTGRLAVVGQVGGPARCSFAGNQLRGISRGSSSIHMVGDGTPGTTVNSGGPA